MDVQFTDPVCPKTKRELTQTLGAGWDFGNWLMRAVGSSALPKLCCGCACAPLDLVLNVKRKEIYVPRCVTGT